MRRVAESLKFDKENLSEEQNSNFTIKNGRDNKKHIYWECRIKSNINLNMCVNMNVYVFVNMNAVRRCTYRIQRAVRRDSA